MPDEQGLSIDDMNKVLYHESKLRGYCLCIVPLRSVVNVTGLICSLCSERVTANSHGETAKNARTAAIRAAYP